MVNNGIITAPLNLQEIYKLLGVGKYNGEYSLNYICSGIHGKTNIYSKFKPIRADIISELSEYQYDQWDWGMRFDEEVVPLYGPNPVPNLYWDNPKGSSNSPYRMTDFIGYNHNAICPLRVSSYVGEVYKEIVSRLSLTVEWDNAIGGFNLSYNLSLKQLLKTLEYWYMACIYFTGKGGNARIVSTPVPIREMSDNTFTFELGNSITTTGTGYESGYELVLIPEAVPVVTSMSDANLGQVVSLNLEPNFSYRKVTLKSMADEYQAKDWMRLKDVRAEFYITGASDNSMLMVHPVSLSFSSEKIKNTDIYAYQVYLEDTLLYDRTEAFIGSSQYLDEYDFEDKHIMVPNGQESVRYLVVNCAVGYKTLGQKYYNTLVTVRLRVDRYGNYETDYIYAN